MVNKPNPAEQSDSPDRLNDFLRQLVCTFRNEHRSDVELLAQFVETGDQEAFRAIVGRYGRSVWMACLAILGDPNDAEDAFQAAFVALARSAGSVDARRGIGPWVRSAARGAAKNLRRSATRFSRLHERAASVSPTTDERPVDESHAWVIAAEELERLPRREREAVAMYHLEGCTLAQVAELLDCSITEARRRVTRGVEMLRAKLSARGVVLTAGVLAAMPGGLMTNTAVAASAFARGLSLPSPRVSALANAILAPRFPNWLVAIGVMLLLAAGTAVALVVYPAPQKPENPSLPIAISAAPSESPTDGVVGVELAPAPRPSSRVFRHDGAVTALVVSPDGKYVASAGADLVIRVWDSATGKQVTTFDTPLEGVNALAFTPDSSALVADDPKAGLTFWDPATGRRLKKRVGLPSGTISFAFTPDGKRMIAVGRDGEALTFDLTKPGGSESDHGLAIKEELAKYWRSFRTERRSAERERLGYAAAYTSDMRTIYVINRNLVLGRVDLQSKQAKDFCLYKLLKTKAEWQVTTIAISQNARWIAWGLGDWGDGNNKIGLVETSLTGRVQMLRGHTAPVATLAFTSDGGALASVDVDGQLIRWSGYDPNKEFEVCKGHVRFHARVLAFSHDGKRLYGADTGGEVRCWDAATLEPIEPVEEK